MLVYRSVIIDYHHFIAKRNVFFANPNKRHTQNLRKLHMNTEHGGFFVQGFPFNHGDLVDSQPLVLGGVDESNSLIEIQGIREFFFAMRRLFGSILVFGGTIIWKHP